MRSKSLRQSNSLDERLVDRSWTVALSDGRWIRRDYMLREICAAALASVLVASSGAAAFAAPASDQAALPSGKAAGVHEAALRAPLWVWIAGVGFVALGVGLVASGNGNGHSGGSSTTTHL
jgi:hypothetical protein